MAKKKSYGEISDDEIIRLWHTGYSKKALIASICGKAGMEEKAAKERLDKILYEDYMQIVKK